MHALMDSLAASLIAAGACGSADYELISFPPSVYMGSSAAALTAMEEALGILCLDIEDFPPPGASQRVLSFFAAPGGTTVSWIESAENSWGSGATGQVHVTALLSQPLWSMSIQGGAKRVGLGFSAFESGSGGPWLTSMSINGGPFIALDAGSLPNFTFTPTFRNGYLLIEAGDRAAPIETLTFMQGGAPDGYFIDYVSFGAPELPADLNDDCHVDGIDLGLLLSAWGTGDRDADLNMDGEVDGADLGLLLGEWTQLSEPPR